MRVPELPELGVSGSVARSPPRADQVLGFAFLLAGGFLVDCGANEVHALKRRYGETRGLSGLSLTVIPTFRCNFACTYCAVGRKRGDMPSDIEQRVAEFASNYLLNGPVPSLDVEWFGGEPLLAKSTIGRLSLQFANAARRARVPYRAQLTTNGALLDAATVAQLRLWCIDRVQITLDGTREFHDRRRPWKGGRPSFDDVVRAVDAVAGQVDVQLRINVDRENREAIDAVFEMIEQRGWLDRRSRVYPYLALVSDFTDACTWSASKACDVGDFVHLDGEWLRKLAFRGLPVLMRGLYGFPRPRPYCCGAVACHSYVVTPAGLIHRCGFDVDDDNKAVGTLGERIDGENDNATFWETYDPFRYEECVACVALPSCLGGCPRNRRDGRTRHLREECTYYHEHEPTVLAHHIETAWIMEKRVESLKRS